jgi:hypothetical protein
MSHVKCRFSILPNIAVAIFRVNVYWRHYIEQAVDDKRELYSEVLAASIIALMMEAASISKTSVNLCQATRRNNPEDSHLHTSRREYKK